MRAGSLRQQYETYAAVPAPAPADSSSALAIAPARCRPRALAVGHPPGGDGRNLGERRRARGAEGHYQGRGARSQALVVPVSLTWNGERFEFITDFLGGGEMGYWLAPGERNTPDPDEYVRIDGSRLRPRDGRYELRVTNELEESLFLDRAELVVDRASWRRRSASQRRARAGPASLHHLLGARPAAPARRRRRPRPRCPGSHPHIDRRYVDGFSSSAFADTPRITRSS